ncbi:N-succinylarginine dihydrolase [Marinobacterium arenosum]|uniref:N-succinylarginine dihydrolase n=1 Tax=Marinobacterium arenosum TaxID=2862496 RepID=UPI001C961E01|nr:N-succinylarginine dihydrolase [Marinobacterium arenosum]MBY4676472.1 N-succinylarginine dihydrolase [Marinobacterium arenosum]
MHALELNLDGLPGPTHHYAGLAPGNLACLRHRGQHSSPKEAALQGLEKMWLLHRLGVPQAVLPPQARPVLATLRVLGFNGDVGKLLQQAYRQAPDLLAACWSASSMWAANAATVTAAADSDDGRVHFTPANLIHNLHRSLETDFNSRLLQRLFADTTFFAHHPPLPACTALADEGAANHIRLCTEYQRPGLNLQVFGWDHDSPRPRRYPARQSADAWQALSRQHGLDNSRCLQLQQHPSAVDNGVFHNDLVATGHRNLLLAHELSYLQQSYRLDQLRALWREQQDQPLYLLQVSQYEISLSEAVDCLLFNSQIVSLPDGGMALIAPAECQQQASARAVIHRLLGSGSPLKRVHYVELRQSMQNGGGPACLRLRVPLTGSALRAMHQGVLLSEPLYRSLRDWVERHYRDRLTIADLQDPQLVDEVQRALDELSGLLGLDGLYPFQQE